MKITKSNKIMLCAALVLILLGSILAGVFNSGNGSVKVSRISFDGENGQLSGLLYMPKDASADNPKPTIIVTHGYLNSAEMQDANAIELSRRGFVVLALDQYDHGHSKLNHDVYTDTSFFGVWLPFWANSMNDAVQYMYDQPYVLKDEEGNGIIGVTGHSMGGFSSTMAMAMDEQQAELTGVRKIYAGLTEGSDFQYTSIIGIDAATADALGGGRIMGKVAAQYDEFFFNDPTVEGGTVRHKDYVSTPDGMTFLQVTEPAKANTWYDTSDGGRRIIYQPAETHPWNHFSKETTAYAISFYQQAFADYNYYLKDIAPESQIWQWKEFSECVALVGFILLIISLSATVLTLPFFSNANTGELPVLDFPKGAARWITIVVLIIAILLPGLFFSPLMDDGANSASVNILFYAGIVVALCGVLVLNLTKKKYLKVTVGAIIWLIRQYTTLFSTGVAAHPGSALSGIMLVAMVPTLSIAAVISRYLYKKTGNVWTAAFLNGILMTVMAIANTMVVFK